MNVIHKMASKYYDNKFLRITIRPIWKIYSQWLEKRRNKRFLRDGLNILELARNILEKNEISYWLEFGTLLGIYRDGGLIKNDLDLDLGAFIEDAERIKKVLLSNGFKIYHSFYCPDDPSILEQTYVYKGTTIDFFYFVKDEEQKTIYCHNFLENTKNIKFSINKLVFPYEGFTHFLFNGLHYPIPSNIDEHLKANYGEKYMIPDPNFNSMLDSKNIIRYDLSEKYAYLRE